MKFCMEYMISSKAFIFGDDFQELFKLQGVKPYLPNKENSQSTILKNIFNKEENLDKRYQSKMLPWDIENAHLIEYRERIRQAPIGIRWKKEELDEFNSLSDVKEKRAMILKKSELKSVYIPHLKWEKEMIKYPNMPHDAESKDNFEKGYKLFQEKKYDEAFPYLNKASNAGNYVATQLLAKILLHRLNSEEFDKKMYYLVKQFYNGDIESWLQKNPEVNKKLLDKHDAILKDIRTLALMLDKQNLPMGQFLLAEIEFHYLDKMSYSIFDTRYRERYIYHLMRAANMGSYDACLRLAVIDCDLEWALCAMIISHDYKCFDEFVAKFRNEEFELESPRNLAIVRLAAMWGSNYAMDCLTFGETGNFLSVYKNQILNGHPNGAIYMPDNEELYRRKIYNQFYGEETGVFDGTLIPELDTIFPPKPVIHSPYGNTMYIHTILKWDKTIKHPLDKTATEADILAFREYLHKIDTEENGSFLGGVWGEHILEKNKEYIESSNIHDERANMVMDFPNGSDEFIGYLNTLKLRELKQNPLYYPSGRPYIYPANVYRKHPDWY